MTTEEKVCCDICCNTVVSSSIVTCQKCTKKACVKCYKKTMNLSTENAQCLFPDCKTYFSLEFLIKNFGRDYIWSNKKGNYRDHREKMLLDQQLVLLPQTQIIIEKEKQLKELDIEYLNKQTELYKEYQNNKKLFENELRLKKNEILNPGQNLDLDSDVRKNEIRCNCPVPDCKGFIGHKWICGICDTKICKKCMDPLDKSKDKIKDKEHTCNEDSLKNVEEIRRSTKPCPTCKAFVFKISGCYQMFCTNCKTFFDWSTLKIIEKTAFVHNPHYTEWLQNGGSAQDMIMNGTGPQCGVTYERIQNIKCVDVKKVPLIFKQEISNILNISWKDDKVAQYLSGIYRTYIRFHGSQNNLRHESNINLEEHLNNRLSSMRRAYILSKGNYNINEFKREIQIVHKKFQKENEYKDIQIALYEYFNSALTICITELEEIDKVITNKEKTEKDIKEQAKNLIDSTNKFIERVLKYYMYSLDSISKMYKLYGSVARASVDMHNSMSCVMENLKCIHVPVIVDKPKNVSGF